MEASSPLVSPLMILNHSKIPWGKIKSNTSLLISISIVLRVSDDKYLNAPFYYLIPTIAYDPSFVHQYGVVVPHFQLVQIGDKSAGCQKP